MESCWMSISLMSVSKLIGPDAVLPGFSITALIDKPAITVEGTKDSLRLHRRVPGIADPGRFRRPEIKQAAVLAGELYVADKEQRLEIPWVFAAALIFAGDYLRGFRR